MHSNLPYRYLIAIFVLPALQALSADTSQMIRDAVAYYDQEEFDSAIVLLEQVLDLEPDNGTAAYELALSHQAKGDWRSCTKVAKRSLRRIKRDSSQAELLPLLSMLQASCHSAAGDTRRALKVFRAAIKRMPDDYGLNFNIAITLLNEGDFAEAIPHLETAVRADPSNPSPYYVIGRAYQALNRSVESLLAYLTFLQYEFKTPRCEAVAQAVVDIAYSRVRPDSAGKGNTIFLDPASESDSPDITTLTLTLALAAIASAPEEKVVEPVAKSVSDLLQRFISVSSELDLESDPDSFLRSYLLADVFRIEEAGVTPAFSYFVLNYAGIKGASEWLDSHSEETDELGQYFELLATGGHPKR